MKNKNNKFLIAVICILVIIILGLFILLFIPIKETIEEHSSNDFIDVETNLDVENINNLVNYVYTENIADDSIFEDDILVEEGLENVVQGVEDYIDVSSDNAVYSVDEDYVLEYTEINYYPEDCLLLIDKNIDKTNLIIEEDKENSIIYQRDSYGDEGFFRVFTVYDKEQNIKADSIAVNLETGDMFGLTPEGILYDYRIYEYNPEWIEYNENNDWTEYETIIPFDNVQLWDNIYAVVDLEKYPTDKLTHYFGNDGTEYYKWTTSTSDNYLLIDYYSGDMFQVVDGVMSSEINAFK